MMLDSEAGMAAVPRVARVSMRCWVRSSRPKDWVRISQTARSASVWKVMALVSVTAAQRSAAQRAWGLDSVQR